MATLSFQHTVTLVCAFAVATAITSEDVLAAQRLHENAPPELQEVFQQLLQEPDLGEDVDQVKHFFQQLRTQQDLDEDEEVEEKEETEEQEANDDDAAEDMTTEGFGQHLQEQDSDKDEEQEAKDEEEMSEEQEAKDEEETSEEREAKDEEETSEDMIPEMVVEEFTDLADSHEEDAPSVNEATELFGNPWDLESGVQHFESPWAFVTDMVQSQGFRPEEAQDILTGMINSVKEEESAEMPVAAEEMTLELPHVGEAGAKNTEAYDGEPLMIRDAADESAARSFHQRTLLQMNEFSFNGNVLNRPKDDAVHWIVQFCPHWWDPCVGLTDSFAKVGRKLEEQLNGALFMRNIRFATVDCASEKVLCNEQEVNTYPTTRHYYKGEFVAGWFGGQANHEEFYTQWLMQQAQGITPETPAGHVVGNLTNSTKGSKEKGENEEIALPTFKEIATDLLLVVVLIALSMRAVLSNARLRQSAIPQQQQPQLPQQSKSQHPQESPNKAPHSQHCRQRAASKMPGAEPHLPSSWNNPTKSMEL